MVFTEVRYATVCTGPRLLRLHVVVTPGRLPGELLVRASKSAFGLAVMAGVGDLLALAIRVGNGGVIVQPDIDAGRSGFASRLFRCLNRNADDEGHPELAVGILLDCRCTRVPGKRAMPVDMDVLVYAGEMKSTAATLRVLPTTADRERILGETGGLSCLSLIHI